MVVLDEAARSHPEVWWWVKGGGCDGLRESVDHKWSGDVDLGDGKLQALFSELALKKVSIVATLPGSTNRTDTCCRVIEIQENLGITYS